MKNRQIFPIIIFLVKIWPRMLQSHYHGNNLFMNYHVISDSKRKDNNRHILRVKEKNITLPVHKDFPISF